MRDTTRCPLEEYTTSALITSHYTRAVYTIVLEYTIQSPDEGLVGKWGGGGRGIGGSVWGLVVQWEGGGGSVWEGGGGVRRKKGASPHSRRLIVGRRIMRSCQHPL